MHSLVRPVRPVRPSRTQKWDPSDLIQIQNITSRNYPESVEKIYMTVQCIVWTVRPAVPIKTTKKQQFGLLRFGSFWVQNEPYRRSLIFGLVMAVQAVPSFAPDWDVFINDQGYITNILSSKWAKSEESNMFKNTILLFLSVRLAVPSIQCSAQSCKFFHWLGIISWGYILNLNQIWGISLLGSRWPYQAVHHTRMYL